MYFLRDSFCLSAAVSLLGQRHDILDFAYCPLSRILHVTLANLQTSEFEFHMRSLPCAFSGRSVNQPVASLLTAATLCWRDPTRSKQLSMVAILGFQFGLCHVVVRLSLLRMQLSALLHCHHKKSTKFNYYFKVARSDFWVTIPFSFEQLKHLHYQPNGKLNVTSILEKGESFK